MAIKAYNSKKALSNYKKGEVCAFYVHGTNLNGLDIADAKTVEKYSSVISKFIKDNKIDMNNNGKHLKMTRALGVVVDKHHAMSSNDIDKITVMFKTADNNYLLDRYVVGYRDVTTNDKEYVLPAAMLNIAAVKAS